jgi:hypothetical protein
LCSVVYIKREDITNFIEQYIPEKTHRRWCDYRLSYTKNNHTYVYTITVDASAVEREYLVPISGITLLLGSTNVSDWENALWSGIRVGEVDIINGTGPELIWYNLTGFLATQNKTFTTKDDAQTLIAYFTFYDIPPQKYFSHGDYFILETRTFREGEYYNFNGYSLALNGKGPRSFFSVGLRLYPYKEPELPDDAIPMEETVKPLRG